MKFLIDAQIPISAAELLHDHGHDVLHTLDLPAGNRTADMNSIRVVSSRIVY